MALYGTGSSLHTWDGWVEALTDEFRVIRLDMPGFGLSGPRESSHTVAGNYREDHFPEDPPVPDTDGFVLPSTCDLSPSVLDGYDISEVTVPTLFQWGREDSWLPESFGRALASRVEHSQFVTDDGVGHVPMEEAPEASAADAAAFLSET